MSIKKRYFRQVHFFLGGLIGDVVGGLIGSAFQKDTMNTQAGIQRDLMKYQSDLQMENTKEVNTHKHQWEIEDLMSAGLNPILSANTTGFASAPSVSASAPSGSSQYSPNMAGLLNSAINQDIQSKKLDNDLKRIDIEKGKLELDTKIANEATIPESLAKQSFVQTQEERERQQITIDRQLADKDIEIKSQQVKTMIQDRVNSIRQLEGQLELWKKQGNAMMVQATAAMISAQASQLNAFVGQQVGESIVSKNKNETAESIQRQVLNSYDIQRKDVDTRYYTGYRSDIVGATGSVFGNIMHDFNPISSALGLLK